MSAQVILVDKEDNPIGLMPKIEAHQKGLLHRAFSILVFNSEGEMLLQKRSAKKYHTPGLWTNTCCSHQVEGEDIQIGLSRRLKEEMGLDIPYFKKAFHFIYRSDFDNGLTEYELDHVYYAHSDVKPDPNPEEVGDWKYVRLAEVQSSVAKTPHLYTPWFKILLDLIGKNSQSGEVIFNK